MLHMYMIINIIEYYILAKVSYHDNQTVIFRTVVIIVIVVFCVAIDQNGIDSYYVKCQPSVKMIFMILVLGSVIVLQQCTFNNTWK